MAKVIKIKAIRLHDLTNVIGALSPQEIAKHKSGEEIKSVSRVQKLFEEMEEFDKPFAELLNKLEKESLEIRDKYQVEIDKILKDYSNLDKDKLSKDALSVETTKKDLAVKELVKKAGDENDALSKLYEDEHKFEEKSQEVLEVKIGSDERFDLLKELFGKVAIERYNGGSNAPSMEIAKKARIAIMETEEALSTAKEL